MEKLVLMGLRPYVQYLCCGDVVFGSFCLLCDLV